MPRSCRIRYAGVERWFEPGRELVVVDGAGAALDAYRELLGDPAQAEEMGARARERVLDEHTFAHRARQLLELVGIGMPVPRDRDAWSRRPAAARAAAGAAPRRDRPGPERGGRRRGRGGGAPRLRPRARGARDRRRLDRPDRRGGGGRRRGRRPPPFNLGIGGAVQTGFRYALEHGFDIAVRLDGDGQHDPAELPALLDPLLADEADIVVGSRFAAGRSAYRAPLARRIGIRLFAGIVSLLVRQRVTDTTSGFQAVNRLAIRLFAADYPHDYPEVEATVMVVRHRLRLKEVPTTMRERSTGRSSITALRSVYYMVKVLLAIFVGLFRRSVVPLDEEEASDDPGPRFHRRLDRGDPVAARRLRADPQPPPARALRPPLAADGLVLLVLSAWRGGLNTIAGWFGVTGYPPAVLFAVATLFILLVLLHYSTVISKLSDQNVILAQRLALLEARVSSGERVTEP